MTHFLNILVPLEVKTLWLKMDEDGEAYGASWGERPQPESKDTDGLWYRSIKLLPPGCAGKSINIDIETLAIAG